MKLSSVLARVDVRSGVLAAAGLALMATAADARITDIFTISNYQPTLGGVQISSISSVTGSYTSGTTASDDTSDITVVEQANGQTPSYHFTGVPGGPGWSQPSAFTSSSSFPARFNLDTFAVSGHVSNNVPVTLDDFVFGGSGTVTVTDSPVTSNVPEPAAWALMLTGFALVGVGLRSRRGALPFSV